MSRILSVIIPVFNEASTIEALLQKVVDVELMQDIKKELIIINDASTDNSEEVIVAYMSDHPNQNIQYKLHPKNKGKGAAIHSGISLAKGDYVVIQDADLEYDPQEYNDLLKPIIDGYADVVYGSRFTGSNPHRILFFWHSLGNSFLTFMSNMFTNLNLTDMETCYKLFKREHIQSLTLKENRFGFEPEVTAKISHIPDIRIYEVGISYYGRSYNEGKKINWKDGLRAIYCIVKYNLFSRR